MGLENGAWIFIFFCGSKQIRATTLSTFVVVEISPSRTQNWKRFSEYQAFQMVDLQQVLEQ